jgi:hypothetical protein
MEGGEEQTGHYRFPRNARTTREERKQSMLDIFGGMTSVMLKS